MTEQKPAAVPAAPKRNLRVCTFCRATGKNGAQFVLVVNGEADGGRFHRPCGEKLAKTAPKDAAIQVVHFAEARRQKTEAEANAFWAEKFAQARAKKDGRGGGSQNAA